jgi:hypothetical protein
MTVRKTLQTFVNRFLWKISNIYWPQTIRKKSLWEHAGEDPNGKVKMEVVGHTLRKEGDAIGVEPTGGEGLEVLVQRCSQ